MTEHMIAVTILPDRRVLPVDAGKMLDRTTKTLSEWRAKGWGPRPIKVGSRVFYSYDECLAMARGEKPVKPAVAA